MIYSRAIVVHGGAGSNPKDSDGAQSAAKIGMALLDKEGSALNAAVQAVRALEDDPRFNAGLGSRIRIDGQTIQMDASCMLSDGRFGAVACVESVQNPIDIAHGVLLNSPHILIAGSGAKTFADEQNIPLIPLTSKHRDLSEQEAPSCDTVGAVAFDGKFFSAALSSGGIEKSALGRVGDVPLPGCGLFCGPIGAVACTGDGEFIALRILAKEVYDWLKKGISPTIAAKRAIDLFEATVDIGLIILTENEVAAEARNGMATSNIVENKA